MADWWEEQEAAVRAAVEKAAASLPDLARRLVETDAALDAAIVARRGAEQEYREAKDRGLDDDAPRCSFGDRALVDERHTREVKLFVRVLTNRVLA